MSGYKLDAEEARIAEALPAIIEASKRREAILAGDALGTLLELQAGYPFRGDDLLVDAAFWAATLLLRTQTDSTGPFTPGVELCLRELSNKPSYEGIDRLHAASLLRQPSWSERYLKRFVEIEQRCDVYVSAGDDDAATQRVGLAALRSVHYRVTTPLNIDLLTHALKVLVGISEHGFGKLVTAFQAYQLALETGLDSTQQAAWLAGYQEAIAEREELPEPVMPEDDKEELLAWVADDRGEMWGNLRVGARPIAKRVPPTRVVISSFKDAKIQKDSPRADYKDIAGKPLPLVAFAGDLGALSREMCARWPWATDAIQTILMDIVGKEWLRLRNTLLLGPPGTGKSSLALAIAKSVGLVSTLYSCAGMADASFLGTSRQWSTSRPSIVVQTVLRAMAANCCIVLDEVEKSGESRHNGNLHDALVPFLEATTSCKLFEPSLEVPVDLSAVSYVGTANSLTGIPAPLRDRFRILTIPAPGPEHLPVVARQIMQAIREERGLPSLWLPDLDGEELEMLAEHWQGGSMRAVRRMIETLLAGRETLAARH